MQYDEKWKESIQMNIKGIAPFHIILSALVLNQVLIGDEPVGERQFKSNRLKMVQSLTISMHYGHILGLDCL